MYVSIISGETSYHMIHEKEAVKCEGIFGMDNSAVILRLYCFMRRCSGCLSDAGTPYRPAPKTAYAEKLFGAGLHGFDTALRALTLDYARLSTNLHSIR